MEICQLIQYISASSNRVKVLQNLTENPQTPRDVAASTAMSHRSAQRILSEMVDQNCVERKRGQYRITPYGEIVARQYLRLNNVMNFIENNQRIFANLPDAHHFPDVEYVLNANVVMSKPSQPIRAKDRYEETLKDTISGTIYEIVPILNYLCGDVEETLLKRGIKTELVIDRELLELAKSTYADKLNDELASDCLELYVHEDPIEFGLAVTRDVGHLTTYTQEGFLIGYLTCTNGEFVDWCMDLYNQYRTSSERI